MLHRMVRSPAHAVLTALALVSIAPTIAAEQPQPSSDLDPRIVKLVQSVSEDRLVAILKKLESFGTRSTLSSPDKPDRGIGAAREWILREMSGYSPRLQVRFDTYRIAKQGRITHDIEV